MHGAAATLGALYVQEQCPTCAHTASDHTGIPNHGVISVRAGRPIGTEPVDDGTIKMSATYTKFPYTYIYIYTHQHKSAVCSESQCSKSNHCYQLYKQTFVNIYNNGVSGFPGQVIWEQSKF